MSEVIKLCEIKLLGKTIYFLPEVKVTSAGTTVLEQQQSSTETSLCSQESKDDVLFVETETSSGTSDNLNTTSLEKGALSPKTPTKKERNETLKKPDKILPCPRCKSMETKFCYFNNYNVNQPRYFCKKCQRYWTAGGVMRSVPVGSGRRKNKNAYTPNYNNIVNGTNFSSLTQNGFILFGLTDGSQNCVPNVSSPYRGQQVQHMPFALGKRSSSGVMIRPSSSEKENLLEEASQERSVLIPKSLPIHDPNEATKSSIWSSLGIKNIRIGSNNGSSPFKAYVS